MNEIIKKIKIEIFYYFEMDKDDGYFVRERPDVKYYYVVFTYRINEGSKLNIERSFIVFKSARDEICNKLLRAVLSHKVYARSKNNYVKLTYEATSQDEFKKLHKILEDNEEHRKDHERMLKEYICARHYDFYRNEWYNISM